MLLNDFYQIKVVRQTGSQDWTAELRLNPVHPLYAGHFPVQPVVPGVCMIQALLETAGQILDRPLELVRVVSCKFLSVVDPVQGTEWLVTIQLQPQENGGWMLQGHCATVAGVFVKAKLLLRSLP